MEIFKKKISINTEDELIESLKNNKELSIQIIEIALSNNKYTLYESHILYLALQNLRNENN
jgi:hypothetical protein